MMGSITSQCITSSEINLSEELLTLANNVTCRTALGKRYEIGSSNNRGEVLHRILGETQALFNGFFFADYFPVLGWLDAFTGVRARLERNFREMDEFYQQVIDDHLELKMRQEDARVEDAIDALLDLQKKGTHLTHDHIKGVLMVFFGPY